MVDLDPEGTRGTQIFCDEIRFAVGGQTRILGQPVKFCSREIGQRNLKAGGFPAFAACWFAAIPPDKQSINAVPDSPVLGALNDAHNAGKGLFVAFLYLPAESSSSSVAARRGFCSRCDHAKPSDRLVDRNAGGVGTE